MRLLYSCRGKLKLTKDLDRDIPRYAILSHTWGPDDEEVTFQDLVDGTARRKAGFDKIEFCATQAKHDDLQYFWIDTCCIDKSNQAELSQAVDSMFRWYQNAARCYVFLSDVSTNGYGEDCPHSVYTWEASFHASRWFTRGWTLQELLAPRSVEFFSQDGQRLGDKRSLEEYINRVTGIAIPALRRNDLAQFSIKERFQWAKTRDTKREEDWAYCLQGIFGVSMPIIYGEGKSQAVSRLEKEITSMYIISFGSLSYGKTIKLIRCNYCKGTRSVSKNCKQLILATISSVSSRRREACYLTVTNGFWEMPIFNSGNMAKVSCFGSEVIAARGRRCCSAESSTT